MLVWWVVFLSCDVKKRVTDNGWILLSSLNVNYEFLVSFFVVVIVVDKVVACFFFRVFTVLLTITHVTNVLCFTIGSVTL